MENEAVKPHYHFILGISLSLDEIHASLIRISDNHIIVAAFSNNVTGLNSIKKWAEASGNIFNSQTLCCMEYAGFNVQHIVQYFLKHDVCVWLRTPLQFKRNLKSHGSDTKVDAAQIANFALLNQHKAIPITMNGLAVEKLKDLQNNYNRLVKAILILESSISKIALRDEDSALTLELLNGPALQGLKESLHDAEEKISFYTFSLKLSLSQKTNDAEQKRQLNSERVDQ